MQALRWDRRPLTGGGAGRLKAVSTGLALVCAVGALAGCGSASKSGDGGGGGGTGSASSGSGSGSGANPFNLITPGTLTVGMDLVQKPQFYLDANGKPAGFDYTLLQKLAADLKLKLVVKNVTFTGLIPGVQAKKFDIASDDLSNTPERAQVVSFTRPYFPNEIILAVAQSSSTPSTVDAWNKSSATITAEQGAVAADAVTKNFPHAKLKTFPDNNGALLEVATGRAQASVVELPILANFQESNPGKLKPLVFPPKVLPPYYGAWAAQKGDDALVAAMNKWICSNGPFIGATYTKFLNKPLPKMPKCSA